MALIRGCVVAFSSTDRRLVRWFKALPSGRFGPVLSLVWQHSVGLQIIAVYYWAREAIPQSTPQPNQSEETRRRWQTVQVIRAPRKPFVGSE